MRYLTVTGVQTCALPISRQWLGGPGRRVGRGGSLLPFLRAADGGARRGGGGRPDRQSVGEGKRVDLGGRRINKKKKGTTAPAAIAGADSCQHRTNRPEQA